MARDEVEGEIVDHLIEVFRVHGYEGTSLSRISEATGLQRASLYYRFPDGKLGMAEAVMERVDAWLTANVVAPLHGEGTVHERLATMAERLDTFYDRGDKPCVLDALSLGDPEDPIRKHVHGAVRGWLSALADLSEEAGAARPEAERRAQKALASIQGSLVLARATGDREPFQQALAELPDVLFPGGA